MGMHEKAAPIFTGAAPRIARLFVDYWMLTE
jgi:hypothetical protein